MRVLTDPAETGAVTLSLPQDVQAEAFDWPVELFDERVWHVARPVPEASRIAAAAEVIRSARRPLVVAGGGVHYSGAEDALAAFAEATGIPVAETQAGKGSLLHGHERLLGAIGSTGTTAANAVAAEADVVIGIGTRWGDFTTASRTAFARDGVRFVNINVAGFDAGKQSGVARGRRRPGGAHRPDRGAVRLVGRAGLPRAPGHAVGRVGRTGRRGIRPAVVGHRRAGRRAAHPGERHRRGQRAAATRATSSLCAAGSMPGDLHKLWRVRDRKGYHVEYGYSCMGYEVPGLHRDPPRRPDPGRLRDGR